MDRGSMLQEQESFMLLFVTSRTTQMIFLLKNGPTRLEHFLHSGDIGSKLKLS